MRLSLVHLDWVMETPFGDKDQPWAPFSLTLIPPDLLKKVLRASAGRLLEREAGDKCASGSRLCFDAILESLTSKMFTALDRDGLHPRRGASWTMAAVSRRGGWSPSRGCMLNWRATMPHYASALLDMQS
eukprot:2047926-Pyramimonas_sp.AAC.1